MRDRKGVSFVAEGRPDEFPDDRDGLEGDPVRGVQSLTRYARFRLNENMAIRTGSPVTRPPINRESVCDVACHSMICGCDVVDDVSR